MSRGRGRANNQTKAGRDRAGQVAQLAQLFLLLVWGEQAGQCADQTTEAAVGEDRQTEHHHEQKHV